MLLATVALVAAIVVCCVAPASRAAFVAAASIARDIEHLGPAFTASPGSAAPTATNSSDPAAAWHVSLFRPPPMLLGHPPRVLAALYGAPVCLAYNAAGAPVQLTASIADVRDALLGNATTSNPLRGLQFAVSSPTADSAGAVALSALSDRGALPREPGNEWPAAVCTSPSVSTFQTPAAALAHTLATPGCAVFVALAQGTGLPCANIKPSSDPAAPAFRAKLDSTISEALAVNATAATVSVPAAAEVYPFVGSLVVSVARDAPCDARRAAHQAAAAAMASPLSIATLQTWGFAALPPRSQRDALRQLAAPSDAASCGGIPRLLLGGSSAIADTAAAWAVAFAAQRGILADYVADGSGAGHRGVKSGERLLGGAETLLTDDDRALHPSVHQVPALAFAVALVFNLPGVHELVLPRCVLDDIFAGRIAAWNHEALRAANPATPLPALPIRVASRAGASGTTGLLTAGLSAAHATCGGTGSRPNSTTRFPYPTFAAFALTSDLIAGVKATPGAIGYASAGAAALAGATVASVLDERTGAVLEPTTQAVRSALDASNVDLMTGVVTPQPAASTYPFVGVTYMLIDTDRRGNCTDYRAAVDWLQFGLTTEQGQAIADATHFSAVNAAQRAVLQRALAVARCDGAHLYPPPPPGPKNYDVVIIFAVIGSVLLFALLGVGGKMFYAEQRRQAALARCPVDETLPFVAMFVGVKNESEMRETCIEESVSVALKQVEALISAKAAQHNCHEARRVDAATVLIVAKNPGCAVDCASAILSSALRSAKVSPESENSQRARGRGHNDASSWGSAPTLHITGAGRGDGNSSFTRTAVFPDLHIGVAHGFGRISKNADAGTVSYHGDVIDDAAVIADAAAGGEIVLSSTVVDALAEDGIEPPGSLELFDCAGNALLESAYLFRPKGSTRNPSRTPSTIGVTFGATNGVTGATLATGHISSALARADAGLSHRRCAVVVINIPGLSELEASSRLSSNMRARWVSKLLSRLGDIAAKKKGHVHGSIGSRLLISVNAVTAGASVAHPMHRAAQIALEVQRAMLDDPKLQVSKAQLSVLSSGNHHTLGTADRTPRGESLRSANSAVTGTPRSGSATGQTVGHVSIGVAAGVAIVGHAGDVQAIVGDVIDFATFAERTAARLDVPIVVAARDADSIADQFLAPTVDVTLVPVLNPLHRPSNGSGSRRATPNVDSLTLTTLTPHSAPPVLPGRAHPQFPLCRIQVVVCERPTVDDEWMYELQRRECDTDDRHWRRFASGDTAPAQEQPAAPRPAMADATDEATLPPAASMPLFTMEPDSPESPDDASWGVQRGLSDGSREALMRARELAARNFAIAGAATTPHEYAAHRTLFYTGGLALMQIRGNFDPASPTPSPAVVSR